MTRIFRYIHVHDAGMAPCYDDGMITLATCKPEIRKSAVPGDWVIGFMPRPHDRGLATWAGKIASSLPHGEYQRQHRARCDAVYRERPDGTTERLRPEYHPTVEEMDRDLSGPVLVFDPEVSIRLGAQPELVPQELLHLAAAGRGHRVNDALPADEAKLEGWVRHLISTARRNIADPPPRIRKCRPCGAGAKKRSCSGRS